MRALLDINVVIALLDPDHTFHRRAHLWWKANAKFGWASCPLTENGVVRIMCHPGYSQVARFAPHQLVQQLEIFVRGTDHEFWPDDISLRDESVFTGDRIHGGRQLTDLYLLALATKHEGTLATFDASIPLSAVKIAKSRNLNVI